ncbi:hypothetical protein HMPREF9554_02772 [Treponema phagedenis F0421]|nr:hypothetical protein HMPREF9554_02772 [Treponema phagedenis F0421]
MRRAAKHFFKSAKQDRFCALKIAQKQPQRSGARSSPTRSKAGAPNGGVRPESWITHEQGTAAP